MRRARTPNTNTNVIFGHVFFGDGTSLLWKGSREHHVDMIIVIVGVCKELVFAEDGGELLLTSAHDLTHVVNPVGADHLIGFINDRVPYGISFTVKQNFVCDNSLDAAQRKKVATLHEIHETARCCN